MTARRFLALLGMTIPGDQSLYFVNELVNIYRDDKRGGSTSRVTIQKNEGPGELALGPSLRSGVASASLHHAAHSAHAVVVAVAAHGWFFLFFRQVGHGDFGGEH